MAVKLNITMTGTRQVIGEISALSVGAQSEVRKATLKAALEIQELAKKNLQGHIRTGQLRNQIMLDIWDAGTAMNMSVDIEPRAAHSDFAEFGTGIKGSEAEHPPLPEGWTYSSEWHGMAAFPYMHPAAEAVIPKYLNEINRICGKLSK